MKMSLIEIKRYLMQVRIASLQQLCHFFKSNPQSIRCLLSHLVMTGKVRQCKKTPACGTKCGRCPSDTIEIYEWIGAIL